MLPRKVAFLTIQLIFTVFHKKATFLRYFKNFLDGHNGRGLFIHFFILIFIQFSYLFLYLFLYIFDQTVIFGQTLLHYTFLTFFAAFDILSSTFCSTSSNFVIQPGFTLALPYHSPSPPTHSAYFSLSFLLSFYYFSQHFYFLSCHTYFQTAQKRGESNTLQLTINNCFLFIHSFTTFTTF